MTYATACKSHNALFGKHTTFNLNIPYVGKRSGAGIIRSKGRFPVLGDTYTVISDGTGDYPAGTEVEVRRSSMTNITP